MTPPPATHGWGHWPQHPQQPQQHHHHHHHGYGLMENHGYPQYDHRPVTSAPVVASTMAPHYIGGHAYGVPSMASVRSPYSTHGHYTYAPYEQQHQQQHQHPPPPPSAPMTMPYHRLSPHEERPHLPMMSPHRGVSAVGPSPGFVPQEHRQESPSMRSGTLSTPRTPDPMKAKDITYNQPVKSEAISFVTPVDVMMKAIQKRKDKEDISSSDNDSGVEQQPGSQAEATSPSPAPEANPATAAKPKKYKCPYDCPKTFAQSTHLETHKRAHTGETPYACPWNGCGRFFTQPGNLKTHYRLHTGERPFKCDKCDARFPQRGNLQAHMKTHSNTKPFECKLDGCSKCFTTRGNLKNHQNKYHKETIVELVDWIVSITDVDSLTAQERDLLWYFSNIYKNSNKGIKGRGRDRRVSDMRIGRKARDAREHPMDNVPRTRMLMQSFDRLGVASH